MKTFEEKFTAWVDGELKGRELEEFEQELAQPKDATLDKIAAHQLGDLLREHGAAPQLRNADFFNHQLMQQIEATLPQPAERPARRQAFWSFPRLALAGAFSLAMGFGLYEMFVPAKAPETAAAQNSFQVIHVQGGDPDITANVFRSQKNDVTVLWLDGVKYVPKKGASAPPAKKHEEQY